MLKLILALILIPTFAHGDDESAAKALDEFTTRIRSEFSIYDDHHDEELGGKEIQALEPIGLEAAKECKANAESKSCAAMKRFKDQGMPIVEAIVDQMKEETRAESPEGMVTDACDATRQIKQLQGIINHEKEVGKVSGVVNATNLHTAGSALVQQKSRLAAIITAYKAKTKKDLKISACK